MRKFISVLFLAFSFSMLAMFSEASEKNNEAWQAVRDGQAVVLMRHALAPGTGDPSNFELGNCATQRNLSDVGRTQAMAIGDVLRANDITEARVLSSQWCRCLETAELLNLGEPESFPVVNSFFQDWSTQDQQTQALHDSLRNWFANDNDVRVIVTHQVNISALTAQFAGSGDMLIVTLNNDEPFVLTQISTD